VEGRSGLTVCGGVDEDHGHPARRVDSAVLGKVLENLAKRSEAALEVGHSGVGDAKQPVLADRILKQLGDVSGELADRLLVEAPGRDRRTRGASEPAGCDQPCSVEILRFVPTVGRPARPVLDCRVQLLGGTSGEVGPQVARFHDPQTAACRHQETCLAEGFRRLSGESVGGRVSRRRRSAHHAGDVPSLGDRGRDIGAHGPVDALVVNDLSDGLVDIFRRDPRRFDVSGEAGIETLHRSVRPIAGNELIDRVEAVTTRRVQPAVPSAAASSSRVIDDVIEFMASLSGADLIAGLVTRRVVLGAPTQPNQRPEA
jgi:hypothetical protein